MSRPFSLQILVALVGVQTGRKPQSIAVSSQFFWFVLMEDDLARTRVGRQTQPCAVLRAIAVSTAGVDLWKYMPERDVLAGKKEPVLKRAARFTVPYFNKSWSNKQVSTYCVGRRVRACLR